MGKDQQTAYNILRMPFSRCFDQIQAAERNFQLAKFGVQQLSQMKVADLPTSIYPRVYSVYPGLMADAQVLARYDREKLMSEIKIEIDKDFPLLSASAATVLWTTLEDLMREFTTLWVRNYGSVIK